MTTESDLRAQGWYQNSDGTWSHPDRSEKRLVQTGDTGQIGVKELGGAPNGYEKYDPEKHG